MLPYLQQLFTYDHWANAEAIRSLEAASRAPVRAVKIMAHVLGAEWLWLARLRNEPSTVAVWPEWNLDEMRKSLESIRGEWSCYFAGMAEDMLPLNVAYLNTQGEKWANTVQDVLMHVPMHSAYHRGQVASLLRESGNEAAYTDFIHCVRQGFLK